MHTDTTLTTPQATTVRAIRAAAPGGAEQLEEVRLPVAPPGPGQVAIDVAFAGVNFAEVAQRRGEYPVPAWPFIPGLEASGTVAAVGDGVRGLRRGDQVVAFAVLGGYAERLVVPAARVFPLPAGLSLAEAAASLVTVTSAVAMLGALGAVEPGDVVVVTAAAGGVGSVAAHVARHFGARRVIGAVGSPGRRPAALAHGYDEVVTYAELREGVESATGGRGADVLLDSVGGPVLADGLAALGPLGRLVKFGAADGGAETLPPPMELVLANRSVMGWSSADLVLEAPAALRPFAEQALDLVARGLVPVTVDRVLPLSGAAEAHRRLEARETAGKQLLELRAA